MKQPRLGRGLRDLGAPCFLPDSARAPARVPAPSPRAAPPPSIVCVTSGKGGTGKSVITSNLAVHLASAGKRVIAVDADMGLANLHLLLGIHPARSVMEVIENGRTLHEVAESGPAGVRLAAGGSGKPEMADLHPGRLRRLVAAMDESGDEADVVLVDTGAGIGRATTCFLYALGVIVVVTTPDVTAMTDGYAVIKNVVRNNRGASLLLVVNRAASAVEGIEVFMRMDRICQKFLGRSLLYLGHVLEDRRVAASVAARSPVLLDQPASPAAACLRGVGRSLMLNMAERAVALPAGEPENGRAARERGSGCA
ncbi:MAG: P-loop NTPase [Acidobacteria bacterium]|nr:P-loop NTPase [Acidobacteriota bacterium]